MSELVHCRMRDGVALVTLDNPPVNALSQALCARLSAAVEGALADDAAGAIVIQAQGRTFCAGADLASAAAPPHLAELCRTIEDAPKPVLAAIHGAALGGGFELALACHYRLVHEAARLGLPDVALGLLPSAGGSQRLARLAGARVALDMLITGRPVDAEAAQRLGLADRVIRKNLARAAFATARNFIRAGIPPRPTRAREAGFADPAAYLRAVAARRAAAAGDRREAVRQAVELVEAALLLPFEAGLAMERAHFEDLAAGAQARALRHAVLAERRLRHPPEAGGQVPRPVAQVGLLGSGRLAAGIARACVVAGLGVTLVEQDAARREGLLRRVREGVAREVERGRLAPGRAEQHLARLAASAEAGALASADLVIEALAEDHEARRVAFACAGAVTRPGAVLASAGFAVDLGALALAAGRERDVIGLRFFAPAYGARLVEVVCPAAAAPDLAATGAAFVRSLGMVPVLPDPAGGGDSLALPVFGALFTVAADALLAGADPAAIDAGLVGYGFALGPFRLADLCGLDRLAALGWPGPGGALLAELAQGGEVFGPDAGGSPGHAAALARVRAACGPDTGWSGRPEAGEIAERAALAMANAGARLVADGVARRPSDIDAAMIAGFGFPRWRGGPMAAADAAGLLQVRNRLRALSQGGAGQVFAPSPLIDDLVRNGTGFGHLSAAASEGRARGPGAGSGEDDAHHHHHQPEGR